MYYVDIIHIFFTDFNGTSGVYSFLLARLTFARIVWFLVSLMVGCLAHCRLDRDVLIVVLCYNSDKQRRGLGHIIVISLSSYHQSLSLAVTTEGKSGRHGC